MKSKKHLPIIVEGEVVRETHREKVVTEEKPSATEIALKQIGWMVFGALCVSGIAMIVTGYFDYKIRNREFDRDEMLIDASKKGVTKVPDAPSSNRKDYSYPPAYAQPSPAPKISEIPYCQKISGSVVINEGQRCRIDNSILPKSFASDHSSQKDMEDTRWTLEPCDRSSPPKSLKWEMLNPGTDIVLNRQLITSGCYIIEMEHGQLQFRPSN